MFLRPNGYTVSSLTVMYFEKERSASGQVVILKVYICASLDNPGSLSDVLFHTLIIPASVMLTTQQHRIVFILQKS